MLKAERMEMIKKLAEENEIVSWDMIQSYLGASKATAVRDINEYSKLAAVEKTRGGVIFPRKDNVEPSDQIRKFSNLDAKIKIAGEAVKYLDNHDVVMIDSGSTVLEMARRIPPVLSLNVVTYYYDLARILSERENIHVYMVGGELRRGFATCHGYMAEQMLESFHANVSFLGADGVSVANGMTGYNSLDVRLKQIMIESSEKRILLVDHSKFKGDTFIRIAPIEKIDVIITDAETDEKYIKALREKNIEVVVAE